MSHFPSVEELIELARTNPEKLESIRRQEIDSVINNAPERLQRRLRGLQFQIDCKRSLHSNPLGACLAINEMMFDSLHRLNSLLKGGDAGNVIAETNTAKMENVIAFPMRAGTKI